MACTHDSGKEVKLFAFDNGSYAIAIKSGTVRQYAWFDKETLAEMIQWFLNPVDDEKEN